MAEERTFFESQPSSTGGSPSGAVHDPSLAFPYLFDNRVSDPYVDRIDHRTNASGSSDSGGSDSDLGDGSSDYGDGSQSNDYIANLEQQILDSNDQIADSVALTQTMLGYISTKNSGGLTFQYSKTNSITVDGVTNTDTVEIFGYVIGDRLKGWINVTAYFNGTFGATFPGQTMLQSGTLFGVDYASYSGSFSPRPTARVSLTTPISSGTYTDTAVFDELIAIDDGPVAVRGEVIAGDNTDAFSFTAPLEGGSTPVIVG